MTTAEHLLTRGLPEALRRFMRERCGLPFEALVPLPGDQMPEPDRRLLVHGQDMTSTLAAFHGSALRVEVLQREEEDTLYFREVFLRPRSDDRIVEYGVIAIALDQFTSAQQERIRAGRIPLGELLHRFRIPFVSAPIGFFAVAASALDDRLFGAAAGGICHGRFNRLGRPTGEALAWILEILPPARPVPPAAP